MSQNVVCTTQQERQIYLLVIVPMTFISEDASGLRSQQTFTIKEKDVIFEKKPVIIKEKQVVVGGVEKKLPVTMREDEDNWFVLFSPAQIEKKAIAKGIVN